MLLRAHGLAKRFGRVEALRGVSLEVDRGEVLALVGDNGAGKSTLIKILSGVHSPDAGTIEWKGEQVALRSPRKVHQLGISTVFQDLAVVDVMSVWRNMFLGREDALASGPFARLNRRRGRAEAIAALEDIGITISDPDAPVSRLSGGQRQSIAIARGVHFSAELLILDEPTSALSVRQTAQVLRSIEHARAKGLAVIVISHNVAHMEPIADRFVVLNQGHSIANFRAGEKTRDDISDLISNGSALLEALEVSRRGASEPDGGRA